MTTSQAEFDAEGVELRASDDDATGTVIRRFRAFERLHHRRQQINTMHSCVAAEVACDLESSALAAALRAVQLRHPLLNVCVGDDRRTGPGFHRPANVPPTPITVEDAEAGHTWCVLRAQDLTCPFDARFAPMIRVVLPRSGQTTPAAIILSIDHAIVDGLSAGCILRDLSSALNGHQLATLPIRLSQEELLIGVLLDTQPIAARTANKQAHQAHPPQLVTPSAIRPVDGVVRMVGEELDGARSLPALWPVGLRSRSSSPSTRPPSAPRTSTSQPSASRRSPRICVCGTWAHPKLYGPWRSEDPRLLVQVQGEPSSGICTFNGKLRIVSVSHDPLPGYLDRVRDILDAAS